MTPEVRTTPLRPGMVIAIECGLYIPEEKIGIRIEDMLLVTSDGGRVLTEALPRGVEEIEKIMAGGDGASNSAPVALH